MAELLISWCDSAVLCRRIRNLDSDFQNGFLLGELLSKYNQQSDFRSTFRDTLRTEDVTRNFAALAPTFHRLGIRFGPTRVGTLMRGTPGVAAHILYELKTRLASLGGEGEGEALTGVS